MKFPDIHQPVADIRWLNQQSFNRAIIDKAVSIGRGLAEEWRDQMRLLVLAVVSITPPASGKLSRGLSQGRAAIVRDLGRMGFVPVEIKGKRTVTRYYERTITKVFGRPIAPKNIIVKPYTAKTRINKDEPASQMDVDLLHYSRLTSKHSGRVTRGRKKAWHIKAAQVSSLKNRLFRGIGKLAAGWIGIANRLKLKLPAWITRHEAWGLSHTTFELNLDPAQDRLFIHAINHAPSTVDPQLISDTQRRVDAAIEIRTATIQRGLQGRADRIAREK